LLAVACPVHRLQTAAIRTGAVVSPETIEVGGADKEADAVAGTKHIAGVVLEVGADDVVFLWGLGIIAVHIHVTDAGLAITLRRYIDISTGILRSSKEQTGGVVSVTEHKATDIFSAHRGLGFTGS